MSEYYNPQRSKNIYDPNVNDSVTGGQAFKLSRSKIENFKNCPRCFYIDRRLGIGQPPGYPFNLNTAVDTLLKKEFDIHRSNGTKHPLFDTYEIDAVPLDHANMNTWRENFQGVQFLHKPTNFFITGAVDDIWVKPDGELIVVDYKSTSKAGEVSLDADWQDGYKRQMEIYQWLLRKNGHKVSDTGYFVYCNGDTDKEAFDAKLEFDIKLIPYTGNDSWVEPSLLDIKACLNGDLPDFSPTCDFCAYNQAIKNIKYDIVIS